MINEILCWKVGECQWTRDGFALGTDRMLPDVPRYSMSGFDDQISTNAILFVVEPFHLSRPTRCKNATPCL